MTAATDAPGPAMVALMADSDAGPVLVATVERGADVLSAKAIGPIAVPARHSLELWSLLEGKAPRSLGWDLCTPPASSASRCPVPPSTRSSASPPRRSA